MNPIGDVIQGIFGGAGEVIGKFKADPTEVLKGQLMLKEMELKATNDLQNFAIQYEGSAKDVPKWVLVLRSIIRPLITMCMFFSLMFFLGSDIFAKTNWLGELPSQYWNILYIVLGFWFGGKIGENIADKLKKK